MTITSLKGQVTLSPVIISGYYKPYINYYQAPDTIKIDLEKITTRDIIVLTGCIRECGEYGGHEEYIKICRRGQNLICWLKIGPSTCYNFDIKMPKAKKIGESKEQEKTKIPNETNFDTIVIQDEQKDLIENYFKEYGNVAVDCHIFSNAPTYYIISYNYNILYNREDPSGDWKGFIELRDKIFKKK